MKNSTRLLILGHGSIGKKHAANAKKLKAEVVTVDPSPEAGADFNSLADAFGKKAFSHAVIATPAQLHLSGLKEILKRGTRRVLLEKPLCLPEESARAEAVQDALGPDQKIVMGFNWRFNSAVQELKRALDSGSLGRVQMAQLYAREWLPKYGGRVLLESGSHILDTARYLLGDIRVAASRLTAYGELGDSDESASLLLTGPEKSDIYVHVNFVNKDDYDYRILVQGSKSTRECRPDRTEPMHLREMEAFLSDDDENLATFDDGLSNLKILSEASKSLTLIGEKA